MYYLLGLSLGLALGWFVALPPAALRANTALIRYSLGFLLVVMGMRIGSDPRILQQLGTLGATSFALAVAGLTGSTVAGHLAARTLESWKARRAPR